jgi:hypothetical protein
MRRFVRPCSFAVVLALSACGGGAAEPTPEPTAGAEVAPTPPPPPPPPPPAQVRVIHASPDPAAATVAISIDGEEPAITDLAYRSATAYVDVPPGTHAIALRGVASVETGDAPELVRLDTGELESESRATVIAVGVTDGEPSFALLAAEDRAETPAEGAAALRFFNGIAGAGAVDVCIAGAAPRDPAAPVFSNVAMGAFGATEQGAYAEVVAGTEMQLQVRQQHATPCRGRVLGVARITPLATTNQTAIAVGRLSGRPAVEREVVLCTDAPTEPSCSTIPLARR